MLILFVIIAAYALLTVISQKIVNRIYTEDELVAMTDNEYDVNTIVIAVVILTVVSIAFACLVELLYPLI